MNDLDAHLDRWASWMLAAGMSRRTIGERVQMIRAFRDRGVDPIVCGWEPIADYVTRPELAPSSRQTYFVIFKAWFHWLLLMDVRADDPMAKMKAPKRRLGQPRPVSTDQLAAALASGRFYGRTKTMVLLASYQGLRAHEIAKIRGEDIRNSRLTVLGKGGKLSVLPLHPAIAMEATMYPARGFWFPSYRYPSQPILARSVSHTVGLALRRAGVDATCHQLRHWYGTETLRSSGGNLRVAQELLRHSSPATTAIYTKIDDTELTAAINALPVTIVQRTAP